MNQAVIDLLLQNPLILLFTVIAVGYPLGRIRIAGISLGVAAVLFTGLAVGALHPEMKLPELVYQLGLVLFVYTVGLSNGPGFFASFRRRGLRDNIFVALILVFAAGLSVVVGKLFQLRPPLAAGIFAGSLTNTPALAALLEAIKSTWRQGDLATALADPVERITALGELIENAEHIRGRIASAARRLQERREALRERLRRFNALFLQGYCPEIYLRVEALTHPPEPSQWPRGAEEGQLQEAERLFRLLERQAQRLAAREIGDAVQVLERQARRTQDPEVSALIAEVQALPPEQPPSARLRRRLAERLLAGGRETP